MSEMLNSLKADLTSSRIRPFLLLAVALLVGAIAYAVISGKASGGPVAATPPVKAPTVPGPSVSQAPANPNEAVAETTNGGKYQHSGRVHDPFKPLPGSKSESPSAIEATSSGASGATSTESGGSSSPEGSSGTGETTSGGSGETTSGGSGETTSGGAGGEPATNAKATIYAAALSLKRLGEGGEAGSAPELFGELTSLDVLPSKGEKLLAYAGAQAGGKGALVLLVMPAIVHGDARCLPSGASCEAIYLKPKQAEELQYLQSGGETATYTLTLTKISTRSVAASEAAAANAQLLPGEREELEVLGVSLPPKVHFSTAVEGTLEGLGEALEASRKAQAHEKQAPGSGE
jgi:hypothetical protein